MRGVFANLIRAFSNTVLLPAKPLYTPNRYEIDCAVSIEMVRVNRHSGPRSEK